MTQVCIGYNVGVTLTLGSRSCFLEPGFLQLDYVPHWRRKGKLSVFFLVVQCMKRRL